MLAIPQQQPAGALDHTPGRSILLHAIGLIDTPAVDDLAAVLGHDVKWIEDDVDQRTLMADLLFIGAVHIHHDGFQLLATLLAQQLEERPNILAATSPADPQYTLRPRIDDHGCVSM